MQCAKLCNDLAQTPRGRLPDHIEPFAESLAEQYAQKAMLSFDFSESLHQDCIQPLHRLITANQQTANTILQQVSSLQQAQLNKIVEVNKYQQDFV
jgi:Tfp pilus assembly protein PilN